MSFSEEYYYNTNINKPINEIWEDIDGFSNEILKTDSLEKKREFSSAEVLLPPIKYNDTFVKGLLVSRAVDYIYKCIPNIGKYFYIIANSMWGSFPKSEMADAYFYCYENTSRENWFKSYYKNRANKLLIPLQDADYTNELYLSPITSEKDIDIFTVARINKCKNLDILLKSLIYIDKKYDKVFKCTILVGDKSGKYRTENNIFTELVSIAGSEENLAKYFTFVDFVHPALLSLYYSRAKITALTSIFEGKNRSIQESVLCNTPVICFEDYNKYIRGNTPILPDGCGYYVKTFSPDAFGEKLYEVLSQNISYNTREIALSNFGRMKIIDKIIKSIPYYQDNIPNINESSVTENAIINEYLIQTHELSYEEFLMQKQSLGILVYEKNNAKLMMTIR